MQATNTPGELGAVKLAILMGDASSGSPTFASFAAIVSPRATAVLSGASYCGSGGRSSKIDEHPLNTSVPISKEHGDNFIRFL
jgi:hypothetical protein